MKIINQLNIKIPALKKPTLIQLQKEWRWIESIERDESTEKAVTMNLWTVLKDDESYISVAEYEKRIDPKEFLGFQHMQWLTENQDKFPELKALLGKIYIDFPGLVVVGADGRRNYPYVDDDGERFVSHWDWMDDVFNSNGRVASSRKFASESKSLRTFDPKTLGFESRISELEAWKSKVEKILRKVVATRNGQRFEITLPPRPARGKKIKR